MQYTKRTLVVAQSRVSEAEGRAIRQRDVVNRLKDVGHPADDAIALLLVMEQSLLSMKRFLATLQHDLELSLGAEKPSRRKISRYEAKAHADELARQVVDALHHKGIEARVSDPSAPAASGSGRPILRTGHRPEGGRP
jgi:antirestriction protein ArdC